MNIALTLAETMKSRGAQLADGSVRFIPNPVALVSVGAPLVIATGIALSRILKALR